jgi:TonB family protein
MNTFKTHIANRILAFVLILAMAIPVTTRASETPLNRDVSLDFTVNPIYPPNLGLMGISSGSVTVLVSVDNTGKMMDWMVVSATRPEFVKSVRNVIDAWQFKPAYKNGVPIASEVIISVKFQNDNVMMSMNASQMVTAVMTGYVMEKEVSFVAKYSQLDRIPEPVNIVQPGFDPAIGADKREGYAVIRFFIDENGNVRMPVIVESKGDERLAFAAYDAISKWKFASPISRGKPITVCASQKFIFKAPAAQNAASAAK